jgi:ribonuclease HI
MQKLTIFTDGGARGNPGPSAIGVVIYDEQDNEMSTLSEAIGIATNNIAEYKAIVRALEHTATIVDDTKAVKITLNLDSQLCQRQLNGEYKVKDATLKIHHGEVKTLEQAYASVEYIHVKRELNKVADALVNQALDAL